eukprot:gene1218-1538_t
MKRVPRVIKELKRKGFHFSGLIIPFVYLVGLNYTTFFTRTLGCQIMFTISGGYFIWECLRLNVPLVRDFCNRTYGKMLREKEKDSFNGTLFYLAGTAICIYCFSPLVAIASMLFLIIGDFCAAVIGISFGKTKIGNKSLEGTVAMFVVCLLIGLTLFWKSTLGEQLAIWGALSASIIELFNPSFLDDNITIPCLSGLTIQLMAYRLDNNDIHIKLLFFICIILFISLGVPIEGCPKHCSSCNPTGYCTECYEGYWGNYCENQCPLHCIGCDIGTGFCNYCKGGYWGTICTEECPKHCLYGSCYQDNGTCDSCDTNYWGVYCENQCPEHCFAYNFKDYCSQDTGCCFYCSGYWEGNCTCSISQQCAKPYAAKCDWYSSCLEPNTASCPYILDTMKEKCQEYLDLDPSLSYRGQEWSAYVRFCLQNVLASTVLVPAPSGQVNCQTATNAFLNSHLNCYLNGQTSFCRLPYSDIGKVIMHGSSILFSNHWYEPLITGTELKDACHLDFWETTLINNFADHVPDENQQNLFSEDPSVSFTTALNQTLLPYQMMLTFVPNPLNTPTNTTSLVVLSNISLLQPINSALAFKLVSLAMKNWISQNPGYEITFNGVNQ